MTNAVNLTRPTLVEREVVILYKKVINDVSVKLIAMLNGIVNLCSDFTNLTRPCRDDDALQTNDT